MKFNKNIKKIPNLADSSDCVSVSGVAAHIEIPSETNQKLRRGLVILQFIVLIVVTLALLWCAVWRLIQSDDIATATLLLMNAVQIWTPGILKPANKAVPKSTTTPVLNGNGNGNSLSLSL